MYLDMTNLGWLWDSNSPTVSRRPLIIFSIPIFHRIWPSTEKHFWKITKQIILVIKKEVIVFVKTNYFKCLHFSISQIKFYQIFQTYSGTITNRWGKFKTMVISPNTYLFFPKRWKIHEKLPFFKKNNHFLLEWQPFLNIRWPFFNEKQPFFIENQAFFYLGLFQYKIPNPNFLKYFKIHY